MSRLGDQIHTLRVQKGLDRKKIAKKAGIADKFLQEVEEGRRIPTDEQAARILSLLGEKGDLSEAFTPVAEESTPPDNAHNTDFSPTFSRMALIDCSTKADIFQSPVQPQTL